jgi:hypothetical protein
LNQIEVKCPKKGCKGYAEASVSNYEGNTEGPCDTCDAQVAFSYAIETDGVRLVRE